ncbi:28608_t:CDS:2, partial [Racocetra persica]
MAMTYNSTLNREAQLKQLIEKIQDWFHQLTIVDQELQSGPLTTTMPTENCEQEEIEKAVIMIEQIREKNPALTFPFSTTETSHQGTSGEQKTKTRPSPLDLTKSQEELEGKGILPRPTTPLSAIAFASPRRSSRKRSISVDAKEHYSNPPLLTVVASNEKSSSSEERKNELLEKIRNNVIEDQKRIEKQNLEENLSNKEKQVAAERRKNTQLTSECDDYKQKLADLEGSRIQLEAENKVYKRSSKDLRE